MTNQYGCLTFVTSRAPQLIVSGTCDHRKPEMVNWDDYCSLETVGIKDPPGVTDDDAAQEHFNLSVRRCQDGRYSVKLPLREDKPDLPDTEALAKGYLVRQLKKHVDSAIKEMKPFEETAIGKLQKILDEQESLGIIEKVDMSNDDVSTQKFYLPSRGVETPSKETTKVRMVFNGSAKPKKCQQSLNELLYRGPVILDDLIGLLLRFRLNKIALAADIEKAFLQIDLQMPDRDLTRFFWVKDPNCLSLKTADGEDNLMVYRFCRVPFGLGPSPALLGNVLRYHLEKIGTPSALLMKENLYVDNLIISMKSTEEATVFQQESDQYFADAKMRIREWMSNDEEVMEAIPEKDCASSRFPKILGVRWDMNRDTLLIQGFDNLLPLVQTKRELARLIPTIYDPLGFLAPWTIGKQMLLNKVWEDGNDWDTLLKSEFQERWCKLLTGANELKQLEIPRFVGIDAMDLEYDLLCFTDASKDAYCAAIYLRIQTLDGKVVMVHLLFAKARLKPSGKKSKKKPVGKEMTIPRIELMAVWMGARLLRYVKNQLRLDAQIMFTVLWTDSQCVMKWIKTKKPQGVFVENRRREIRSVMDSEKMSIRYVETGNNPADVGTREMSARELMKVKDFWFQGPTWLKLDRAQWPHCDEAEITSTPVNDDEADAVDDDGFEDDPVHILMALSTAGEGAPSIQKPEKSVILLERFSNMNRLIRATTWMTGRCIERCIERCKGALNGSMHWKVH